MARGIFRKQNGQWKRVTTPSFKEGGVWKPIQKGFVKENGVWKQFYPSDVVAKILVVGGGGGGGIGYGCEGGGGGGAGGVVFKQDQTLSVLSGNSYNVIVGDGGGANASGGYSLFGTGGITVQNTSSVPVYAGTYPVYNGFLNTYGVWTNPGFVNPVNVLQQVIYSTYLSAGGRFTVRASADNEVQVFVNGVPIVSNGNWARFNDGIVDLPAGAVTITVNAVNRDAGSPGLFAAALYNGQGKVVWDTRAPINYPSVVVDGGITALGGGNGGWGVPEQTAGFGGSGGGGCGYVYTHEGGPGFPGQGYKGGTGIWEGFGQAGGGGGGGFSGEGAPSNGNAGGAGGNGISLLGYSVGGGGGGGYGNQTTSGTGPGGPGGSGGGGAGNGGNAVPNTGGGGGGGLHGAQTSGGRGGAGRVVVQYSGSPAFTGGTVTYNNGITTHDFTSSGSLTAIG